MDSETPPYPLYNSTFLLYRVSPLYHGDAPLLQERALQTHSRRLRDVLKGDNLRGVQVDFASADSAVASSGPLNECEWNMIGDESSWVAYHQHMDGSQSQDTPSVTPDSARGLMVDLYYAKHSYNALLLRDPVVTTSPTEFTNFPLLLVRMPAPIREIFLNYISTTFDARVSPFKPNPSFLTSALESHLTHLTAASSTQSIPEIIKVLGLQLTFPALNSTLLKHIDLSIARDDVPGFHTRGKLILQRNRSRTTKDNTPFTTALSEYLAAHLALTNIDDNKNIHVSKIGCGAFNISTDGKLKLFAPAPIATDGSEYGNTTAEDSAAELAMRDLYTSLIREATRQGPYSTEDVAMQDADGFQPKSKPKRPLGELAAAAKKRARGRTADAPEREAEETTAPQSKGRDSIPAEPPPPYELHDPSLSNTA
jgi:hypothetical protein